MWSFGRSQNGVYYETAFNGRTECFSVSFDSDLAHRIGASKTQEISRKGYCFAQFLCEQTNIGCRLEPIVFLINFIFCLMPVDVDGIFQWLFLFLLFVERTLHGSLDGNQSAAHERVCRCECLHLPKTFFATNKPYRRMFPCDDSAFTWNWFGRAWRYTQAIRMLKQWVQLRCCVLYLLLSVPYICAKWGVIEDVSCSCAWIRYMFMLKPKLRLIWCQLVRIRRFVHMKRTKFDILGLSLLRHNTSPRHFKLEHTLRIRIFLSWHFTLFSKRLTGSKNVSNSMLGTQ